MINWAEKNNQAILVLKKKYNTLLQRYKEMEDGSVEVKDNPIFRKINNELKDTAYNIADLEGSVCKDVNELFEHFKAGELHQGFQFETISKAA